MRLESVACAGVAIAVASAVFVLSGCGSASSPSSTPSGPSRSTSSPTSTRTDEARQTFAGNVVGKGLTCLVFVADDGSSYNLTGHVPAEVAKVQHQRGESIAVQVTGQVQRQAASTCGLPVLVATAVETRQTSAP